MEINNRVLVRLGGAKIKRAEEAEENIYMR